MPAEVVKDVVEGEEYPDGNEEICRLNSAICKPCVYRTHRIKYLIYKRNQPFIKNVFCLKELSQKEEYIFS